MLAMAGVLEGAGLRPKELAISTVLACAEESGHRWSALPRRQGGNSIARMTPT